MPTRFYNELAISIGKSHMSYIYINVIKCESCLIYIAHKCLCREWYNSFQDVKTFLQMRIQWYFFPQNKKNNYIYNFLKYVYIIYYIELNSQHFL